MLSPAAVCALKIGKCFEAGARPITVIHASAVQCAATGGGCSRGTSANAPLRRGSDYSVLLLQPLRLLLQPLNSVHKDYYPEGGRTRRVQRAHTSAGLKFRALSTCTSRVPA